MTDEETRLRMDVQFTPYGKKLLSEAFVAAALAYLMRDGAYRVTDNGDGTYTHEWIAKPRDNGEASHDG